MISSEVAGLLLDNDACGDLMIRGENVANVHSSNLCWASLAAATAAATVVNTPGSPGTASLDGGVTVGCPAISITKERIMRSNSALFSITILHVHQRMSTDCHVFINRTTTNS